ncbi:MAG: MBL fold metallo-hydrolase [Armatimonadetes bacterium]|nr:MBL fold metallo-hydrolase [Armatimonadota bacterium]
MATLQATRTQWTPAELHERLNRGEEMFILDVRNRDEFEAWRIEGRKKIPTINIPYFDILEAGGADDIIESVMNYARAELASQLPKDRPVLVVCAKGGTSDLVAEGLRQLGYEAINLAGGTLAWGNYYATKAVVEEPALSIYQVSRPARGCLSYVVVSHGEAVVIDPLRHVDHYLRLAEEKGFQIRLILDTHAHADHISGGSELSQRLGVPYYLHPYDGIHPIDVLPAKLPYQPLWDGQRFQVGEATIETIHIPGHTLGNVVYLVNGRYLMTGDSIFIESIARPDLGGRGDTWAPIHYGSLAKLLNLPAETVILPGHFSSLREADENGLFAQTLGTLKAQNEGLQMVQRGEEEFVRYILSSLPTFPPQYVDIKRVNAGLLVPDEDKASELELGKNICALAQAYRD